MVMYCFTLALLCQIAPRSPSIDGSTIVTVASSHHLRPAYVTKVTADMLRRTPSWLPTNEDPPLSVHKAIAAADAVKSALDVKPFPGARSRFIWPNYSRFS